TRRASDLIDASRTQAVRGEPPPPPPHRGPLPGGAGGAVRPAPHRDQPAGALQALAAARDDRDPGARPAARVARGTDRRDPLTGAGAPLAPSPHTPRHTHATVSTRAQLAQLVEHF